MRLEATNLVDAKKELKQWLSDSEPEGGFKEAILLECTQEIKKIFDQPEWSDEL